MPDWGRFGLQRCDWETTGCGHAGHRKREGVLVYMRQEGRGIGLLNKCKTYSLQDQGRDTVKPIWNWASRRTCGITVPVPRSWPTWG